MLRILAAAFLLMIPQAGAAPPLPAAGNASICIAPRIARRTGSSSCWVSFSAETPGGRAAMACLPRVLWLRWLDRESSGELCVAGKWKVYSPHENSPYPPHPKSVRLSFWADSILPRAKGPKGLRAIAIQAWVWLERLRERISNEIGKEDRLGICANLLLGQSRPRSPASFLRILGFVHLLSMTGIHLYALSAFWKRLLGRLSRALGVSATAGLRIASLLSASSWVFAWLLCGARAGMIRPMILVGARALARTLGLRWRKWAPITVALGLDAAWSAFEALSSPSGPFQRGRLFYALAVGGGMMGEGHLGISIGSWTFSALWEAWQDGLICLATPFLSFVTLPVFAGFLFPMALWSAILPTWIASFLFHESVKTMNGLSIFLLRLDLALPSLWVVSRPTLVLAIGMASLFFLWGKRTKKSVWLGTLVLLLASHVVFHKFEARTLQKADLVEQLDVGQGDAALVSATNGHAVSLGLIDAGSARALTDTEWIRLFSARNATRLDWIGLTHLDEDHSGGVSRLARILPIGCLATSLPELESARGKKWAKALEPLGILARTFSSGCVPWPVLPPLGEGRERKANANMAAFFIPLKKGGFYLGAGDADRKSEPRIGRWAAKLARSINQGPRILKISHHGSRSSSAPEFLREVHPTEAWISSGVGNRYGHPHSEVLRELSALAIPVRRTDEQGAIRSEAARRPPRTHPP